MTAVLARVRTFRHDLLLRNSALMLVTTVLMAGSGAVFWLLAARLADPGAVGLAGSLATTAESLALFAQLGLNIALVRTIPNSDRKAADVAAAGVVVVVAALVLTLAYALLLPTTSPRLSGVLHSPAAVALYCALVAATALNVLTDSVFLAINRVVDYLRLNGVLMGLAKLALVLVLAGTGALGLYGALGGGVAICAAASIWVIFRHLPTRHLGRPSRALLSARRFAGAGYVTYLLTVLPLLVYPLLVINTRGAEEAGVYFVSFQLASLLHAVVLAVANSTYAEAERARTGRRHVLAKGGAVLVGCAVSGAVVMALLAPLLLLVFGEHYADEGPWTLRLFAFAMVAAAFNYWGATALRLSHHLRAMIGVQLVSTVVMVGLALLTADRGTEWVAASWGLGHLVGGVLSLLARVTIAPVHDDAPDSPEAPGPAPLEAV